MTDEEIRALIASEVNAAVAKLPALIASEVADAVAKLPALPDLSGYAAAADVSTINNSVLAIRNDIARLEADLAMRVDTGEVSTDRETARRNIWLARVLEKYHGAERPTNAELAPEVIPIGDEY